MNKLLAAGQETTRIGNPALGEPLQNILKSPLGGELFLSKLLPRQVGMGFVIGVIVFFFVMLIGAIQWMLAGGDKAALEQARGKIINAIIGLVILFSLFAIVKLLEDFFGTNILTIDIGPLKIE